MNRPVTEHELHLYIDGQLDEARRSAVEAYIESQPDEAARIDAYRYQNALLRDLGAEMAEELPGDGDDRVRNAFAIQARRRIRARRWRRATAAAALLLAAGMGAVGSAAWHGDTAPDADPFANLSDAATQSFFARADQTENSGQPSGTTVDHPLAAAVRLPDLTQKGFALVGGRVVSMPDGQSIRLLYRDKTGRELVLLLTSEPHAQRPPPDARPLLFYTWSEGPVSVAVGGGLGGDELRGIAEAAQRSLHPAPPQTDPPPKPQPEAQPASASRT